MTASARRHGAVLVLIALVAALAASAVGSDAVAAAGADDIVFRSNRSDGNPELYTVHPDGSGSGG